MHFSQTFFRCSKQKRLVTVLHLHKPIRVAEEEEEEKGKIKYLQNIFTGHIHLYT